jgi:hypothetical protein
MTDRLHLSATKEQQILIEEAEDRSERRGIARGIAKQRDGCARREL